MSDKQGIRDKCFEAGGKLADIGLKFPADTASIAPIVEETRSLIRSAGCSELCDFSRLSSKKMVKALRDRQAAKLEESVDHGAGIAFKFGYFVTVLCSKLSEGDKVTDEQVGMAQRLARQVSMPSKARRYVERFSKMRSGPRADNLHMLKVLRAIQQHCNSPVSSAHDRLWPKESQNWFSTAHEHKIVKHSFDEVDKAGRFLLKRLFRKYLQGLNKDSAAPVWLNNSNLDRIFWSLKSFVGSACAAGGDAHRGLSMDGIVLLLAAVGGPKSERWLRANQFSGQAQNDRLFPPQEQRHARTTVEALFRFFNAISWGQENKGTYLVKGVDRLEHDKLQVTLSIKVKKVPEEFLSLAGDGDATRPLREFLLHSAWASGGDRLPRCVLEFKKDERNNLVVTFRRCMASAPMRP